MIRELQGKEVLLLYQYQQMKNWEQESRTKRDLQLQLQLQLQSIKGKRRRDQRDNLIDVNLILVVEFYKLEAKCFDGGNGHLISLFSFQCTDNSVGTIIYL
jgi:hypothetical protein